jgi:predicted TIM-barrel fold metal-dependent hydrolase
MIGRRDFLAMCSVPAVLRAERPAGLLIDTHVHLFAGDPKRFPYATNATYRPPAQPVEAYVAFARQAGIAHAVIVHPEPYQDDHRYLEYSFRQELSPGFFKGTCLFDPIAPGTPARMEELVKRNPGRIVALRIHENHKPGTPPTTSGAIRDRDLRAPAMLATWRQVQELELAIQMHFIPHYAPQIGELAARFPQVPVILDHLGRPAQGTPSEYEEVLNLARRPRTYMKFSGLEYAAKLDLKTLTRRIFDAFGPRRILWGMLGMNTAQFDQACAKFDELFTFASAGDRARIRGLNAAELFRFQL